MSDSTPTERFTTQTAPLPVADELRSRRTLIILLSVGGGLLVALIILLTVLFTRSNDDTVVATPTESPTASSTPTPEATSPSPSATPTPTETEDVPAPPPAPTGPIESFTVDKTSVNCDGVNSVKVHFAWKANGLSLWFGVGVNDAMAAPYGQYELTDELDFDYQCGQSNKQQKYTITVKPSEGNLVSQSIIITE